MWFGLAEDDREHPPEDQGRWQNVLRVIVMAATTGGVLFLVHETSPRWATADAWWRSALYLLLAAALAAATDQSRAPLVVPRWAVHQPVRASPTTVLWSIGYWATFVALIGIVFLPLIDGPGFNLGAVLVALVAGFAAMALLDRAIGLRTRRRPPAA